MFRDHTEGLFLGCLIMAVIVAASNFLVRIPVGEYLTWGAFTYPFAFLVTDVMNRRFGPQRARRVVYAGFAVGVVASIFLSEPRIAMASGSAFLAAQLLDVQVFNRLREGIWWKAPLVSSIIAGTLDSLIFWPGAFLGSEWADWPRYGLVDWAVKLAIILAMLLPYRALTLRKAAAP